MIDADDNDDDERDDDKDKDDSVCAVVVCDGDDEDEDEDEDDDVGGVEDATTADDNDCVEENGDELEATVLAALDDVC